MTVVNRSTSSLQQQIASSDMDRRTRAGRGAVSRISAEADSGSLRAARSGPSPLLDPYPKTLGPAAPRRPGASPTGNIQLKCMSTGERDTSMVMAATGGGRRLPRSLMPTNVPRAEPQSERRRLDPMVDASMIDIVPQRIPDRDTFTGRRHHASLTLARPIRRRVLRRQGTYSDNSLRSPLRGGPFRAENGGPVAC